MKVLFHSTLLLVLLAVPPSHGLDFAKKIAVSVSSKLGFGRNLQEMMLPGATSWMLDINNALSDTFDECFNIKLNKDDPLASLYEEEDIVTELTDPLVAAVSQKCSSSQETAFKQALDSFETCSDFSIESFIELLPSAWVGTAIHCTPFIASMAKEIFSDPYSYNQDPSYYLDLPGMQECMNAEHGQNLISFALYRILLEPGAMRDCFKTLEESLPACTRDVWPIPIVGKWVVTGSCVYTKAVDLLEDFCNPLLQFVDEFLPTVDEIDTADCKETIQISENILSINAPIPDVCARVAESDETFSRVELLARYNLFRDKCAVGTPWENSATTVYTDPFTGDKSGNEIPEGDDPLDIALGQPIRDNYNQSPKQSLGGFFGGVVASVLVMASIIVYRKSKRKNASPSNRYSAVDLRNNELELT